MVSPSVLRALSRYFDLDARVIPNGVDTRMFNPSVARLARFGPEKRTLLFLGRFDPRNGLLFMLRAFAEVRKRIRDVRLVVVGAPARSGTSTRAWCRTTSARTCTSRGRRC